MNKTKEDMTTVTHQRLKELLCYDNESGLFYWKVDRNKVKLGDVAGRPAVGGYVRIRIDSKDYLAHRLAWFYVNGFWPKLDLDHINRVADDNRIINLREATKLQNVHNRSMSKNNTSGFMGVSWSKTDKKWKVQLRVNYRRIPLGSFDCPLEGSKAYLAAQAIHHAYASASK